MGAVGLPSVSAAGGGGGSGASAARGDASGVVGADVGDWVRTEVLAAPGLAAPGLAGAAVGTGLVIAETGTPARLRVPCSVLRRREPSAVETRDDTVLLGVLIAKSAMTLPARISLTAMASRGMPTLAARAPTTASWRAGHAPMSISRAIVKS